MSQLRRAGRTQKATPRIPWLTAVPGFNRPPARSKPADKILDFSEDCAKHVVEAYCPIIRKHLNDPYTPEQKHWQAIRRGRYVEFNLIYDRGTIFGLKTGGRIESILMSLPVQSTWL